MSTPLAFEPNSVRTAQNGMIALWSEGFIMYSRVRGHFIREHAAQIMRLGDELLTKHGKIEQFHDWSEMTGFDLACQKDLTLWVVKIRRQVRRLSVLASHPMVLVGVRVANSALQGAIHLSEDRDAFVKALNQRVGEQRAS